MNLDDIDLYCDENDEDETLEPYDEYAENLFHYDPARFDFEKFVISRTANLSLDSYVSPPPYVRDISRTEKKSSNDSGVYRKNEFSPEIHVPCLCKGSQNPLNLSTYLNVAAGCDMFFPLFDSESIKEYAQFWKEFSKQQHFPELNLETPARNSLSMALTYIKQGKILGCSNRTIFLAMRYFHAYVSCHKWEFWGRCTCSVYLLSDTCLILAAKLEEHDVPYLLYGEKFPKSVIMYMQTEVAKSLGWRLLLASPYEILKIMVESEFANSKEVYEKASDLIFAQDANHNSPADLAVAGLVTATIDHVPTREELEETVNSFKHLADVDCVSCVDLIRKMTST